MVPQVPDWTAPVALWLFAHGRPPEPRGNRGLVEFPLDLVLRVALVKAEDLVRQVEAIHDIAESMSEANGALCINLQVSIKVLIAKRSLQAAGGWSAMRHAVR